jgi:hypothetical protein
MSDLLKKIEALSKSLSESDRDDSTNDLVVHFLRQVLAEAGPRQAEIMRRCAIPRWFNTGVLTILRGRSDYNERILEMLRTYSFVQQIGEELYIYHDEVRIALLQEWRGQRADDMRLICLLLANYYDERAEVAVQRTYASSTVLLPDTKERWTHEALYCRLIADQQVGMAELDGLFRQAISLNDVVEAEALLQVANEVIADHKETLSLDNMWEALDTLQGSFNPIKPNTKGEVSRGNIQESAHTDPFLNTSNPAVVIDKLPSRRSPLSESPRSEPAAYALFRRAIVDRDDNAWADIYTEYRPLLLSWARQASTRASSPNPYEDIADRALTRAWSALSPNNFAQFPSLAALLGYLRACVGAAAIDSARAEATRERAYQKLTSPEVATPEQEALDQLRNDELWKLVGDLVLSEPERTILVETFVLGLSPRQIQSRHQDMFLELEYVYRLKRSLVNRLKRNRELRQFYEEQLNAI